MAPIRRHRQVVEIIDAHDKHKTLAWNRYGQLLLYRDCSNSESHLLRVTFTDHQGAQQTLSYAYDALGQLLSESSDAGELDYRYDALGSLETLTLPDQRQLNHLYYGSGHLYQLNLNGRVIYDAGMLKPYKTGSPAPPASQRLHRAVFAFALHHS